MNNAKNNKQEIELTSEYLFLPRINHENHLKNVQIKINTILNDNDKTKAIENLNHDITNIMTKYNEMNASGLDQLGKIGRFLDTYKFMRNNNEVNVRTPLFTDILTNPSIVQGNNVITPEAHSILNKANIVEGDNTGFNFFNVTTVFSSTLKQAAESHNKLVKQNDDLYKKVTDQQKVLKNQTDTIKDLENEIQNKDQISKAEIVSLENKKKEAEDELAKIQRDNNNNLILLAQQKTMIDKTRATLREQKEALDANNTIKEQAQAAAKKAQTEAAVAKAVAKAEAEAAQTAAKKAQTEAAAAKADATAAKADATAAKAEAKAAQYAQTQAEDAKKNAEAKAQDAQTQAQEAQTRAEQATATAEQATATAEQAKADADKQLTEMREKIEQYTEANKELIENKASKQAEIDILNKKIDNTWKFLKNQTATHQEALEKQKVAQQQQIEELKNQHKSQISLMKQSLILKVNKIKEIEAKTEDEMYAKQEKIEALNVKFEEQEAAHKDSIAELENINKKIIGEKDAHIKELTSEVTKLKIDKDGNVKGPLTTITRLFPLAWQNSKGYNIGNIITLVRGDKPYSTTDNVDHYLYNLFQSIQEDTGKTSTDAKKKYDKKYKSSPYQQHVSKNIPINKGNNNIARATMIEKNHNSNSNDKIFQTSLATVVPSPSTKKSKKIGGERKSKKHQKQKKHNNTKKQKINKTKK